MGYIQNLLHSVLSIIVVYIGGVFRAFFVLVLLCYGWHDLERARWKSLASVAGFSSDVPVLDWMFFFQAIKLTESYRTGTNDKLSPQRRDLPNWISQFCELLARWQLLPVAVLVSVKKRA